MYRPNLSISGALGNIGPLRPELSLNLQQRPEPLHLDRHAPRQPPQQQQQTQQPEQLPWHIRRDLMFAHLHNG